MTWRNGIHLLLIALLAVPFISGGILSGEFLSGGFLSGGTVIDMAMSGQPGSVSWNVNNLMPGSHGDGSVNITNTGTIDRTLFIWVGNITGDEDIGRDLLLSVSHPRLTRSIVLPATVYDFPQSPDDSRYIAVSPVAAGETITINWTWTFQEAGQPQNEAMGKQIGFRIYYTLRSPPLTWLAGWPNATNPGEWATPTP
ncbi:MAG: hypothetical protein ABFC38_11520 [Methanospirillum sp.]